MLINNIYLMKRIILLAFILISAGCVKESHLQLEVDDAVRARIDTEISCADYPEDTCAVASEFKEFEDRAFTKSTPENPVQYHHERISSDSRNQPQNCRKLRWCEPVNRCCES